MAVGGGVDFGTILLPGSMAVAIMFSGIAAVALPLSTEFGITREIDDRVMCPLPLWAVALEKVCFSAMQSIIAALLVIPMAYYVPTVPVRADVHNWFRQPVHRSSARIALKHLDFGASRWPRRVFHWLRDARDFRQQFRRNLGIQRRQRFRSTSRGFDIPTQVEAA